MKIEFPYNYLQACLPHASKQDVRFYLCGIYIGDGFMAATNGHAAIVIQDDVFNGCDYIVPREVVDFFTKKLGQKPIQKTVTLTIGDDGYNTLESMGVFEYFRFTDGKFPDIKRINISKPENPVAAKFYFNPKYLSDFQKSAKFLTGHRDSVPCVITTGENTMAYIDLHAQNAHGLLMPLRV